MLDQDFVVGELGPELCLTAGRAGDRTGLGAPRLARVRITKRSRR